jgi:predicted transglutaminase-like cysteine proteinase
MPALCGYEEPASVPVSMRARVLAVNAMVNDREVGLADRDNVALGGAADHWDILGPDGAGDCEDIALTKYDLLAWEIPRGAMRLARVHADWSPGKEDHIVLLVRIGGVDFVLDNRTPIVWPIDSVSYRLIAISAPGDPLNWTFAERKSP